MVFKLFDATFGKVFRLIQLTLDSSAPTYLAPRLTELVHLAGVEESAKYAIDKMSNAMIFRHREELWEFCVEETTKFPGASLVLEFGVHKGYSINYLARLMPEARIIGFDSFEGLQENWTGTALPKGFFDLKGEIPVSQEGVTLIGGWFENSLPGFLSTIQDEQIRILHMDADTYTPTKYVLEMLRNNLGKGSVIIFDEYFGYSPSWKQHEFRAFQEFVSERKIEYTYLAYSDSQVAVRLL